MAESERARMIAVIEERGRDRARAVGETFSEADYIAGAMSVLFALDRAGDIPAHWFYDIWRGDSPLGI